jgi:4'-phosphopantetheinyl transferase
MAPDLDFATIEEIIQGSFRRRFGKCQERNQDGQSRTEKRMKPMNFDRVAMKSASEIPGSPSLWEWRTGASLLELNPGDVRAWLVDLDSGLATDEVEAAEPGPELEVLSDDERARAARFVRARDRRRFARCRTALREILGGLLGRSPAAVRFLAVGHGKPVLDFGAMGIAAGDGLASLRFNLSHSSELALIGVCWGHELGVDLERIKQISEADRIVASFFSPAERAEFTAIPDHAKPLAFFRGWTRKEAVLKGLGTGLAGLSAQHETGFGMAELPAHFVPASPSPGVKEWRLWEAAPRPGFVATVAVHLNAAADSAAPA